ncbi:hypothetical protein CIRG_02754 [Coccidioides immitis RMSCC 2394]|uniref:Uncharacterized protein n=1 Tax=Coccidioides immitis RMSCC 2394 TaxID=404692 RepID=A0A0J7AZZ8_COCIT|nr:hypothetical protein CIRG_02754 [Coccidioides immitis RMSCC 2394]
MTEVRLLCQPCEVPESQPPPFFFFGRIPRFVSLADVGVHEVKHNGESLDFFDSSAPFHFRCPVSRCFNHANAQQKHQVVLCFPRQSVISMAGLIPPSDKRDEKACQNTLPSQERNRSLWHCAV